MGELLCNTGELFDHLFLGLKVVVNAGAVSVNHCCGNGDVDSVDFAHTHELDVVSECRVFRAELFCDELVKT